MSVLLVIDSSPHKFEQSYGKCLGFYFAEQFEKYSSKNKTVIKDLYEDQPPCLDRRMLAEMHQKKGKHYSRWVKEFIEFDRYLIITHMWNSFIPGILKMYLDLIMVPGYTFDMENNEYKGLLQDKKVVIIEESGKYHKGFSEENQQMGYQYLHMLFNKMGVSDITQYTIDYTTDNNIIKQQVAVLSKEIENKMPFF